MTTFQDPPPQSRRSARQSERSDGQATPADFGQFPPADPQQQVFFEAAQPPVAPPEPASPPTTGRRSRPAATSGLYEVPPATGEPLNYMTQGQSASQPTGEVPPLAAPSGYYAAPQDYVQQQPAAEPAPFRVRDFSPEGGGRRAAVPPLIEPDQPLAQAYSQGPSDLDYRTQAGPVRLPETIVVSPPASAPAPVAEPTEHQTLSRREIRQRQAEADAAAEAAAQVTAPQAFLQQAPVASPSVAPQPVFPAAAPVAPNPALLTNPALAPNSALLTNQPPPPPVAPVQPPVVAPSTLSSAMAEFEALTRAQVAPPAQAAPPAPVGLPAAAAPPAPASRVRDEQIVIEPEIEHTGGYIAPAGHWSRQADLDDETQPWENTITREVGGSNVATTTSALVLPAIPRPNDFPTALNSTGEILLTGSINLPASLGSVGGDARRYDDPNVDYMFETQDGEFSGTDSSPVRAIRAVSTHTSGRGVIHANKPHGNRMLTVLLITASAMAAGVVALLVASFVLKLF